MKKAFYDLDGQKKRRKLINNLVTDYTLEKFDKNGRWQGQEVDFWNRKDFNPGLRERFWFAAAFLETQRQDATITANAIIKNSKPARCEFAPMGAVQLLAKYKNGLEDESVWMLENYIKESASHFLSDSMDFVGVNDNFPSMAAFTSLIGGKMINRPDSYERGIIRLGQLKDMLVRRGVATEYNSPTYSSIQICAMAEIANLADDDEVRELALNCEERLWVDMLGHYHHGISQVAGPYSRAYTVDSTGHTHQSRFILYALLGDKMKVNPLNTLFETSEGSQGEVIHGWPEFMQVSTAWLMNVDYHCPEYLIELGLNKKYPYLFKASTEFSSSTDASPFEEKRDPYTEAEVYEYPAGTGSIITYMTEDYALGVASNEFHRGVQTDSFHILYRKAAVESQSDIGTVYSRYIINEEEPSVTSSMLDDKGRKIGIQHKNSAMMLYKPVASFKDRVRSLKLSLIIPAIYGPVDELWLGKEKLAGSCGESIEPCPVYVRAGNTYMYFHPLLLTDYGRKAAVKVNSLKDFIMISFYNYEGEEKDFARRGFLLTGNGFVTEVRNAAEAGSFENFRKMMDRVSISDELFNCMHTRQTYLRRTAYQREGLSIKCEYSPVSEGIKYITVNGKAVSCPKLEVTGFDTGRLPFADD